ncbi:NAD-dependent protein deacetylase [Bordetella avium]|uniref:NAD-dependent protein deacetylase n=1 Tax=Bordetella avium TaxID=521 RepID=UPI000E0AB137|nr:NAD-dependent protein deacetylase [Bordetella avium]RIQ13134.1 NAD-dependent protein deacetylase [Bordetella avium]RIQ37700.1 NAD-dependent protein deacetylase [Bordetella avium]RIQ42176.1 NAD-dependent protein deacetylase [Bordetella avium]RIQ42622.1 NAD-dependent protein deacetylase [Bordetella avium]RIQ49085.1 NAD-dependent protein deacetylase [Bordetella avium]
MDTLPGQIGALRAFIECHSRLFVLTGAGCSTPSGIPDYRDGEGHWKRKPPIDYQTFMATDLARARYWARGMIGWRRFGQVWPNAAHAALARLEAEGRIELLVTQNVDGLHQAAGSRAVIDLHGRLDEVICTHCDWRGPRKAWQEKLEAMNPAWMFLDADDAPDGDADLDGLDFSLFEVPACPRCGGIVKPDVVFFGELVPSERTTQAYAALARAHAMLVVGSSLMVHSGFRYVQAAVREGKPVAAINLGRTRADDLLTLKISQPCDQVLAAL